MRFLRPGGCLCGSLNPRSWLLGRSGSLSAGDKVRELWARLTARPATARRTYWALFCLGSLAVALLLAGVLEEFHGHPRFVAFLSRLVSGPSYALWQRGCRIDWNQWEAIMLYSTAQWTVIWLTGYAVLAAVPRLSHALAMGTALALVGAIGLFGAKTPGSPLDFPYDMHRIDRAVNEQTGRP
jgi:hypothetical protein